MNMDQPQAQAPTKGFLFPLSNGSTKKPHRPPPPPPENQLYRECLKNHAASLGGHALDGCGEFMPSPAATPTDPTSLKCAACGCHRNFHRRAAVSSASGGEELEGEGEDDGRRRSSSSPPPPPSYFTSAPHTLLALSRDGRPVVSPAAAVTVPRKRFRSKFSAEQKGRMLELSERLGWRMQRRDEGVVAEYCKAIGVGIGVFKIWMHNNKYHLFGCRRGGGDGGGGTQLFQGGMRSNVFNVAGELGGGGGGGGGGVKVEGNGSGVDSGEADGNGLNGSSSSS